MEIWGSSRGRPGERTPRPAHTPPIDLPKDRFPTWHVINRLWDLIEYNFIFMTHQLAAAWLCYWWVRWSWIYLYKPHPTVSIRLVTITRIESLNKKLIQLKRAFIYAVTWAESIVSCHWYYRCTLLIEMICLETTECILKWSAI